MATTQDMWGELETESLKVRTPVSILKEQAALIGQKTKNILEAEVRTESPNGPNFRIVLDFVVPSLDNYRYRLLSATHPITLYPLEARGPGGTDSFLQNETAFLNWLRVQLSSEETRRIIGALLSQATS